MQRAFDRIFHCWLWCEFTLPLFRNYTTSVLLSIPLTLSRTTVSAPSLWIIKWKIFYLHSLLGTNYPNYSIVIHGGTVITIFLMFLVLIAFIKDWEIMYVYHINSLSCFLYHMEHSLVILKPAIKDNPLLQLIKRRSFMEMT